MIERGAACFSTFAKPRHVSPAQNAGSQMDLRSGRFPGKKVGRQMEAFSDGDIATILQICSVTPAAFSADTAPLCCTPIFDDQNHAPAPTTKQSPPGNHATITSASTAARGGRHPPPPDGEPRKRTADDRPTRMYRGHHPMYVAAAREPTFAAEGHGCVVSIWELLDELSGKFGDRFPVSPDTYEVLDLIETLWARPARRPGLREGMDPVRWNEKGLRLRFPTRNSS